MELWKAARAWLYPLLCLPVLAGVAGAAGISGPVPVSSEPGAFRLQLPEGQRAWQLPEGDGLNNNCDAGDALSVRWSPDGRYLLAEIDTGERITLCLYDLTAFSFEPSRPKTVIAQRISGSGGPGPNDTRREGSSFSQESVYTRLARAGGGVRYSFTELEAQWSPDLKQGPPLAFTRRVGSGPERVFGLKRLSGVERPDTGPLDGAPVAGAGSSNFYQPAWVPPGASQGGSEGAGPGLAFVSDAGLAGCGRSRIVYLERPGQTGGAPRPLTSPCTPGSRQLTQNAADRYAAWGPAGAGLAFIRANPGIRNLMCIAERPLSTANVQPDCTLVPREATPQDRFFPRWTQDGRFLVYFASATSNASSETRRVPAGSSSRIEVIDLQHRAQGPRVLRDRVRPAAMQGPALIETGRKSWVLAVLETAGGSPDRLVAVPIEAGHGGGERELEAGLQNIKAVDVMPHRSGTRVAVVAQGYRDVRGADLRRDKIFILPLPPEGW